MSTPWTRSSGLPVRLAVALGLALLLVGSGGTGCGLGELHSLPPALVGNWTTTHPRYRGRSIEIQPRRVVLVDLGHPIDRYSIEGIRSWTEKEGVVYELRCVTEEGEPDELRLTLASGPPAYIRVGEAPAHWTRTRSRHRGHAR